MSRSETNNLKRESVMFAQLLGWFQVSRVLSQGSRLPFRPVLEEMEQRSLPSAAFPTTVGGESVHSIVAVTNARELALDDYGPFPYAGGAGSDVLAKSAGALSFARDYLGPVAIEGVPIEDSWGGSPGESRPMEQFSLNLEGFTAQRNVVSDADGNPIGHLVR